MKIFLNHFLINELVFDKQFLYMLHYDRIAISKGIDVAKRNSSKECIICHYWFLNRGLKFQNSVCNICDDLPTLCLILWYCLLLLKALIIVVLFTALANLKQSIYEKMLYWMVVSICKKMHMKEINIKDSTTIILINWSKQKNQKLKTF